MKFGKVWVISIAFPVFIWQIHVKKKKKKKIKKEKKIERQCILSKRMSKWKPETIV